MRSQSGNDHIRTLRKRHAPDRPPVQHITVIRTGGKPAPSAKHGGVRSWTDPRTQSAASPMSEMRTTYTPMARCSLPFRPIISVLRNGDPWAPRCSQCSRFGMEWLSSLEDAERRCNHGRSDGGNKRTQSRLDLSRAPVPGSRHRETAWRAGADAEGGGKAPWDEPGYLSFTKSRLRGTRGEHDHHGLIMTLSSRRERRFLGVGEWVHSKGAVSSKLWACDDQRSPSSTSTLDPQFLGTVV